MIEHEILEDARFLIEDDLDTSPEKETTSQKEQANDPFGLRVDDIELAPQEIALARRHNKFMRTIEEWVDIQPGNVQEAWYSGQRIQLPLWEHAAKGSKPKHYHLTASKANPTNQGWNYLRLYRSDNPTRQDERGVEVLERDHFVNLNYRPSNIPSLSELEDKHELTSTALREIGTYLRATVKKDLQDHDEQVEAKSYEQRRRRTRYKKAFSTALSMILSTSTVSGIGGELYNWSRQDDVARDAFDDANPELPTDIPSLKAGDLPMVLRVNHNLPSALAAAPLSVNSPYEDFQSHDINRVRRFDNSEGDWWETGMYTKYLDLDTFGCFTIPLTVGKGATAQVTTINPSIDKKITVDFNLTRLKLCNESPDYISPEDLKDIYVDIDNP